MNNNILNSILKISKVKYTNSFAKKYFSEHPDKYNLYGLSSMLSYYGINNIALKIKSKEEILKIEPPFVVHKGGDFMLIENLSQKTISFLIMNKRTTMPLKLFIEGWSGIVLLFEVDENSIEPNYKEHKRDELINAAKKNILQGLLFFLLIICVYENKSKFNIASIIYTIVNIMGFLICLALLLRQLGKDSFYGDKMCFLFSKKDCNRVLDSDASKIYGILSWSEIGFGYFISNIFLIAINPQSMPYLAVINVISLPCSIWSFWYQKFKLKQWCSLCIMVQAIFWVLFIVTLIGGLIQRENMSLINFLFIFCIYALFILGVNMLIKTISRSLMVENINYEIHNIKATTDIFKTLLKKQAYFDISDEDSHLLFGDPNAKIQIAILSNPHCNPCGKIHNEIEFLIKQNKDISVRFIFTYFNRELCVSNKFLIALYFNYSPKEVLTIYSKWFEKGKYDKEKFFKRYPVDMNSPKIIEEIEAHRQWKEQSGLNVTPVIIVNGYRLPDNYKIEDLNYIDVNVVN